MERKNDIPFEHQMMFVLRNYDIIMAENVELRKEVEELSLAVEELGGTKEYKSLKHKVLCLKQKNESLANKLQEKNKRYEEVYRQYQNATKKKNILIKTLRFVKTQIFKMLGLVDVPALRKLTLRITADLDMVEHTNCMNEMTEAV